MDRVRVVIEGRVQGVGFRAFVLRQARALEVAGAVWNREDGAVELEAEGDKLRLEQFLGVLRDGPPAARVSRVSAEWAEGPSRHHGFNAAPTRSR